MEPASSPRVRSWGQEERSVQSQGGNCEEGPASCHLSLSETVCPAEPTSSEQAEKILAQRRQVLHVPCRRELEGLGPGAR
jgi:hypothetical protein